MLVLTRRDGEKIRLITPDGQSIEIVVVNYPSPRQVRIGVDAPQNYKIHRVTRDGEIEANAKAS